MNKLVTFAFAIAVLGMPATTRADDTDQAAKQSFERGRQLASEAKWTQAFDAFSAGYDASHRSVFLFNMAECARALDDAPRARGLYQQYLATSPTGDLAETARARLAAMPGPVTPASTTPPPPTSPTVSTTRPTTTTSTTPPAPTTVATGPVVPAHATTLSTPPTTKPAPATSAIGTTTTTTTAPTPIAKPAPSLTVAQLPPTSPAEHPIGTSLIVDSHPSEPIWRRTSFWVGVGVAVAATTVAIIAASSSHDNSCSSPGCIDLRK